MKVNATKTAMMCLSDLLAYEADAFINDADGNRIGCCKNMKILGMHFSNKPDMSAHVQWIRKTIRQRYWTLRNLKRSGFTEQELVRVYSTVIRPIVDYACVVYHSSIVAEQDDLLERLQNHALLCIFGPGLSARERRERANITTLRKRREELCDKFAQKCLNNPNMQHFFPLKSSRASAKSGVGERYLEKKARCDRLWNSPIFYMHKRLNGKTGKKYAAA